MGYLSGFVAKKRDVEKETVREAVRSRMTEYTKTLLMRTVGTSATVVPSSPHMLTRRIHWDYTLMPIWLLTYSRGGKSYPFAMNGHTGKVYGRFPVSPRKLAVLGAIVGVLAGAAAALFHYFVL